MSSSLTGATVTGPSGSPAAVSVDLGATNPNTGDQVSFTFNLPDGTHRFGSVDGIEHDAAAGRQLCSDIGGAPDRHDRGQSERGAEHGDRHSSPIRRWWRLPRSRPATISSIPPERPPEASVNNQQTPAAPITGATALSGAAGTDSLATSFAPGDTITVNGTPITFVNIPTSRPATELNVNPASGTDGNCCRRSTRSPAPRRPRPSAAA